MILDAPIFETERLVFHPFAPDDHGLLADLHADPEVQRYIGGAWTALDIQGRLDSYVAEQARFEDQLLVAHFLVGEFERGARLQVFGSVRGLIGDRRANHGPKRRHAKCIE